MVLELLEQEIDAAERLGTPTALRLSQPMYHLARREIADIAGTIYDPTAPLPRAMTLYGLPIELHDCVALAAVSYR